MMKYYIPDVPYSKLRGRILRLLMLHGKNIHGTVLHVGSGVDYFRYRQYFPNAKRYRCLDIKKYPNVDIIADVQNMPEIPSNSEDCIIATFFLLKVLDIRAALGEIKRIMRLGGVVFFTFLNHNWKRYGINKMTKEEALELLDEFFRDRRVHQSDIGIAVIAYKTRETPFWSGIEIAKSSNPPHLQAKFEIDDKDVSKTQKIGGGSVATYEQRKTENGIILIYRLIYNEKYSLQIKTWIKMRFKEQIKIHFKDGSIETIHCRHDTTKKKFNGIKFGTYWDRMKILAINETPPIKFVLDDCSLEFSDMDQISHIILYRKKNFGIVEFAFIWKRVNNPKHVYKFIVKLLED